MTATPFTGPYPRVAPARTSRRGGAGLAILRRFTLTLASGFGALIGGFPGHAKVSRDALLNHQSRAMIEARVRENPGTTAAELVQDLGIPYNTVDYHIRRLEKDRLLVSWSDGRRKHMFGPDVPKADWPALAWLRNSNTQRLLAEIRQGPGRHQRALAKAVGIKPTSIAWHLARLQTSGLVRSERTGHGVVWLPSAAAQP